mmetsp:Transcript_43815/g.136389  ORF Transcript_43815/g.136389 Transcript_43815/m.136389 type:complete len:155 (+) Transcript_43815:111-575(+)
MVMAMKAMKMFRLRDRRGRFEKFRYEYRTKKLEGKVLDEGVLQICRLCVKGSGDGRISKADTLQILRVIRPTYGSHYRKPEKDTMAYVRRNFKWTEPAAKAFKTAVARWAGQKAAATKKAGKRRPTGPRVTRGTFPSGFLQAAQEEAKHKRRAV